MNMDNLTLSLSPNHDFSKLSIKCSQWIKSSQDFLSVSGALYCELHLGLLSYYLLYLGFSKELGYWICRLVNLIYGDDCQL